jgi:hypothetical protein
MNECPLVKRRRVLYGRIALAVGVGGVLYNRPPQNVGEWAVVGAGAYVGMLAVDRLAMTYPDWSVSITAMGSAGKSGCGCK